LNIKQLPPITLKKLIMKKYINILFLLALLFPQGCKNFVEGINDDPNNPYDAPLESVINAALTGMIVGNEGHEARISCMWSGQFSGVDRQYAGLNQYSATSQDFHWEKFYLAARNAEIAIEKGVKERNLLSQGIGKIVKAQCLGTVASLYGDIPFSEANSYPEVLNAKFDPQKDVYAKIQVLLDEAIAHLNNLPSSPSAVADIDFYYGGDAAAWTKAAYSLKARFFLHTKDYASAQTAAAKGISGAADEWIIPHTSGSVGQDMNVYFNFGKVEREGYMDASAAYLPELLDNSNSLYRGNAKTDESARFAWFFTGKKGAYDLNYGKSFAPSAPFPLFTAEETHLIEAESFARLSNFDNALLRLNAARQVLAGKYASGKYEAYTKSDFEAGGIANISGKSALESILYEIVEEKYCSLVGQIEVFNDTRRTDNLLGIKPNKGSQLPERLLIPQVELDANNKVPNPLPSLFLPTAVNM
jgi:starch-binding outer membrane protein, SusD/RagB family